MTAAPRGSIAHVAFDLGGVLVDVDQHALTRGLPHAAPKAVETAFFADGRHTAVSTGALSGEAYLAHAAATLAAGGQSGSPADCRAAWQSMVHVASHTEDVLARLRVPCSWWSNTDPVHFAALAAALPALHEGPRVTSFDLGAMKPDVAFYKAALARVQTAHPGLEAFAVLFVDDRAENIAAARAMGLTAVRIARAPDVVSVLADHGCLD